MLKIVALYQSTNTLLFSGAWIIVIWLAALAVLNIQFSVGMLFAFISDKDQFINDSYYRCPQARTISMAEHVIILHQSVIVDDMVSEQPASARA
jgi:hypothetical protein